MKRSNTSPAVRNLKIITIQETGLSISEENEKKRRVTFLSLYDEEGDDLLSRIVTRDQTPLLPAAVHTEGEVKTTVNDWLLSQVAEFYDEGIQKFGVRYDKCLKRQRNNAEKWRIDRSFRK
ncbi:hypothetical protein AVEN_273419-1 [Araneus ventricosus]|uniref:Uncharacterized protein n=1 Tax=Araneus ventricosus TaxID=182803 RepID=A0A4Y2DZC7_ARAVE|nr:hypothetical protein AVEN_273419-1 [Araneus ventricosus]